MTIEAPLREELVTLSRGIHAEPELGFTEHRAVARIAEVLTAHGHAVERGLGGVETAFRARIGPPGPTVALLAEYDALPDLGHACAHNLITMTTVGAFLLAARDSRALQVGVALIGTPAEEGGGGKVKLLEAGAFAGVIAALSSHASADANWVVSEGLLGRSRWQVRFTGVSAHATVSPRSGRNALNAVIALFNGVAAWGVQWPEGSHVNGIISEGGVAPNIIPARAVAEFGLRARTPQELTAVEQQFTAIARGAAQQTGTTVELLETAPRYDAPKVNAALAELLDAELRMTGTQSLRGVRISASSDIGNVSQVLPADYIAFPVTPAAIPGHSVEMRAAAVSDLAHRNAMLVTEVLASSVRRIASDAGLRDRIAAAS